MSLTLEQVVTQLEQEAITLKAKVLIELGLQMQYVPSAISRQVKFGKTFRVSLICSSGRSRQRRSLQVLEWSAAQVTEVMHELIGDDFDERGARSAQSGARAAADARSTLGSHEF